MKLTNHSNHPINISSNIVDNVTKARTQNPTYSPDGKYLAYQYVPDLSTTAIVFFIVVIHTNC